MVRWLGMRGTCPGARPSCPSRRKVLKTLGYGALGSGLAGALSLGYATRIETERIQLQRVKIPLGRAGLEGFKIAFLSDFHLYPTTQLDLIERAVGEPLGAGALLNYLNERFGDLYGLS